MINKTILGVALAAACVMGISTMPAAFAQPRQLVTNGPQVNPGDVHGWSARRDVINSERYDRLVETNPSFRAYRMRKECGPVTDPRLHAQCIASFSQYEGSSMPMRRRY